MLRNSLETSGNSVLIQNQNSFNGLLQNAKQKFKHQFLKLNFQTPHYQGYTKLILTCGIITVR